MGLDITIKGSDGLNVASWSYSGFNTFRERLAKEIGLNLSDMVGFGGKKKWPKDDIVPLLNHSDCDGELKPTMSLEVRLRELISKWEYDYDHAMALVLAGLMAEARARKLVLIFH